VFFNNPDLPNTRSELTLPLMAGTEIIGALDVQSDEPNAFDQDDIRNLGTLADQISIAIQNARQYEETRRALAESEALSRQFVQTGWGRFTRREKLEGVRHTGAQSTLLYSKPQNGGTGRSEQDQFRSKGRGAVLSLPVKLRGEVIGTVNVRSSENRQWDQDELDIVNAIIERSAVAMENARLLNESQKLAAKERTIGEISAKLSSQSEINDLLKIAAQELSRNLPGMQVAVQLSTDQETH
jgi:GAF domain-containing protein